MENLVKQILDQLADFSFRSWPENWMLKLLSLIFAIFLWYFVVGEDKVDQTLNIPIEIINLPRDLIVSNQYKKDLQVTISGPRGLVRSLSNQHLSRPVDFSKATPGKLVIRNEPDDIPFSRSITVLRIQPANTTFKLERIITKHLPLKAVTIGELAEGMELVSIYLTPAIIKATGSEEILASESRINTLPIDLTGINGSIVRPASLDLKPEISDLIGELEVEAQITVREKNVEVDIPAVVVAFNHKGERTIYHLSPPAVRVKAEIPYFLLKKIDAPAALIIARIEAQVLPPGDHTLDISVSGGGGGVHILDYSPKTLTMHIGEENHIKKRIPFPTADTQSAAIPLPAADTPPTSVPEPLPPVEIVTHPPEER